jgi:GNAT superfamily N-acetyltransferase
MVHSCAPYDTYHRAGYHRVPSDLANGEPFLLAVEAGNERAALPFLVRDLAEVPWLDGVSGADATSTYGYPGALANQTKSPALQEAFFDALRSACDELGVVSLFVRQNPLIDTNWLLSSSAEVIDLGPTVAVDLRLPEDQIRAAANSNHRRNLKKTDALEPEFVIDDSFERLEAFMAVYNATMERNEATAGYFFPERYYLDLKRELGPAARLFHAIIDGEVTSSVLALASGETVQYHLGGTDPRWARDGLARWTLEQVRIWAKENGFDWFHLGGGVGASEDSLFRFKAGFAKTFRTFSVARYIHDPARYAALVAESERSGRVASEGFFPAYRG